jgi:hypothetical protein
MPRSFVSPVLSLAFVFPALAPAAAQEEISEHANSTFSGAGGKPGLLPGGLASGFALAIRMATSGGAWDNAKRLIEGGGFKAVAEENGVRMPSFFGYMAWSICILTPLFMVVTFLFFR